MNEPNHPSEGEGVAVEPAGAVGGPAQSALGTADTFDASSAADSGKGRRSTCDDGGRTEHLTPEGVEPLPPVDEVPADIADPGLMKVVLSRMFERHRDAPMSIGRLRVLDRLGQGGMGVVYAAYDEDLDRKVAVKVLRPRTDDEALGRARLLREAQTMARLTHPNVATVYEAGTVDDGVFLSMEFIRGESLDRWLREGEDRGWREVVDVFLQAGHGLAAAHRAGIIHRDFKPHNVMLGRDGSVKVLDFGLARTIDVEDLQDAAGDGARTSSTPSPVLTRTGALMGTPAYMAPEQYDAEPTTERSDQFSFCVALHEGLYGRLPYAGDSLATLSRAVLEGHLRPVPAGSSVPQWVRRVILRGLSRDPEDRFGSMDALLAVLARDPGAQRRRIAIALSAVVAVGAGGFGLARAVDDESTGPSCDEGRAELAEVWSPEQRAALGAVLSEGGVAGGETWERIAPRLDAYAEEWIGMRDEACATHRDEQQSDRMFDRRTACLDQRLSGFATLTELLAVADGPTMDKAPTAVAGLPPIAYCGDTVALEAAVEPPADPGSAAQVQDQREQLARAKEHEDLGQFEVGLGLADEAVEVAAALEYRPLAAEALLRRGSMLMEGGRPDDAESTLTEAFLVAIESAHPEVAVEALSKRMFMRGEWMGDAPRALEDRALAEALFKQVPHAQRQYGVYLNNLAMIVSRSGEFDEASRIFGRAVEIKRESFGPRHPEVAMTLANVGMLWHRIGDPLVAEAQLEEAVDIGEETLGSHHYLTVAFHNALAAVLIEQGRLVEARARLDDVHAIHAREPGESLRLRDTLLGLLQIDLEERRYEQARTRAERALELAEASGSPYLKADPLHGKGLALIGLGEVEEGLQIQAEAYAEAVASVGEDDVRVLNSRTLLARGHALAGQTEQAVQHLRSVFDRYEGKGNEVLVPFAQQLVESGAAQEAKDQSTRGLELLESAGARGGRSLARLLVCRGRASLALGQIRPAITDLRRAISLMRAAGCDAGDFDLAMARFALARALRDTPGDDVTEASRLASEALEVLRSKGPAFHEEVGLIERWIDR